MNLCLISCILKTVARKRGKITKFGRISSAGKRLKIFRVLMDDSTLYRFSAMSLTCLLTWKTSQKRSHVFRTQLLNFFAHGFSFKNRNHYNEDPHRSFFFQIFKTKLNWWSAHQLSSTFLLILKWGIRQYYVTENKWVLQIFSNFSEMSPWNWIHNIGKIIYSHFNSS